MVGGRVRGGVRSDGERDGAERRRGVAILHSTKKIYFKLLTLTQSPSQSRLFHHEQKMAGWYLMGVAWSGRPICVEGGGVGCMGGAGGRVGGG